MTPRSWPAFSAGLRGAVIGAARIRLERRWRDDRRAEVARRERFFHWELEFPEAFFDDGGEPRHDAGFDAVIGNPPWAAAGEITAFSRESGCYSLQGHGHANLYQLFAERMLQLAAPGGRVGMLMPSGLLTDHGCAPLRAASVRAVCRRRDRRLRQPRRALSDSPRRALLAGHGVSTAGSTAELQARAGRARGRRPGRYAG